MAVAGVIVIIVLKVVNPRKKNIAEGIQTINNATGVRKALDDAWMRCFRHAPFQKFPPLRAMHAHTWHLCTTLLRLHAGL